MSILDFRPWSLLNSARFRGAIYYRISVDLTDSHRLCLILHLNQLMIKCTNLDIFIVIDVVLFAK